MILGSVLLLAAVAAVVILIARQAGGTPTGVERGSWAALAIGLFLAGGGVLAAGFFVKPDRPASNPDNTNDQANNTQPVGRGPSEPVTDQEKQRIAWLHRNSAEVFIDRPGFGLRRMILPLEDVVNAPKKSSAADPSRKLGTDNFDVFTKLAKDRGAHFAPQELVGNKPNMFMALDRGDWGWKLKKVQLVGLMKQPRGVVYDTHQVPGMKDAKDIPTRDLDEFEKDALKALTAGGENLVIERHGDQIRAMGPLYAGSRCVSCHEQKGQLLGAFTYTIERAPILKPRPGEGE